MHDKNSTALQDYPLTGLRRLVFVGCGAAVLAVMLVALYLQSALEREGVALWQNQTRSVVQSLARQVETELEMASGLIQVLAELPQFKQLQAPHAIVRSVGGVPETAEAEKRQLLKRFISDRSHFSVMYVLAPNADHYLAEPYQVQRAITKYNMLDRDYFQKTLRNRSTVISDGIVGADGKPVVVINVPVINEVGEITSHVGGVYHLGHLSRLITDMQTDSFDELLLLDSQGQLIAHSNPEQIQPNQRSAYSQRPEIIRLKEGIKSEPSSAVYTQTLTQTGESPSQLAFAVPLSSGWYLAALRDRASVLAGVRLRSNAITATTVVILLIIAALSMTFLNALGKRWQLVDSTLQKTKRRLEAEVVNQTRELKESHQHIALLLDSSGAGIFGIDPEGCCTFFNNACREILKFEADAELCGRHFFELVRPRREDGTPYHRSDSPIAQALIQNKRIHREHELFCNATGDCLPVEYRAYPMRNEGRVVGAVVTFNDISARIQAQDAQAASDARFRTLFDQSHDAMFLIDPKSGRYLDANAAAETLTGRDLDTLLQLTSADVTPKGSAQRLQRVRKLDHADEMGEVVYVRPDGSERTAMLSVVPLPDGLVFGIARDVTDQRASEEALRENEDYLEILSEATFEAIILSEGGRCLGQNLTAQKMFGYTTDEAQGRPILEWIAESVRDRVTPYLESDESILFEADVLNSAGETFPAEIRHTLMRYQGQDVSVTVIRDISEQRSAERELKRYNTLLNAVIDQAPFAITLSEGDSGDWTITLANREAQRITGASVEQQRKLRFVNGELTKPAFRSWEMFNPDGSAIPIVDTPLVQAMQRRMTTRNREMIIRRGDGVETFVLGHASPIYGEQGELIASIFTYPDISEHKRTEETIRTLSQAMEQSPVSVVITDPRGVIEYVNRGFERSSGYHSEEVIGQHTRMLGSGNTPREVYDDLWHTITVGDAWQGEFQNRRKDGTLFWEYASISPIFDPQKRLRNFLAVKEDITLRKVQEEKIIQQAHYDSLTGLPNRFLALDRLSQILRIAQRDQQIAAVLFLDLDDFKKVNDTLGHEVGDQVIIEAARRVSGAIREEDTVGRLGGDEFIVLLSYLHDRDDAGRVAEKILSAFRTVFNLGDREVLLTTSIGISVYPEDGEDAKILLRNADTAMYHAKSLGRNAYHFYTDTMNRDVARRVELEEQLHGALNNGEFYVLYQPIMDLRNQSMVTMEALLRWDNPKLGQVPPDEFIEIAERTGRIVQIGEYVLRQAADQARQWYQRQGKLMRIAINVSPVQFKNQGFVPLVKSVLQEYDLPGSFLEIEVTENVLLSDRIKAVELLSELRQLGITISMDDFGTGYSSLSYLRHYPFDTLKIDRSFVRDITTDKDDRELVVATITMAKSLGLRVIAEGVETAGQLAILQLEQCDYGQGYYFSKPIPANTLERLFFS